MLRYILDSCLSGPPTLFSFHSLSTRGFIAMEINRGYKHPAGHVQVRGSRRGVAGRRPPYPLCAPSLAPSLPLRVLESCPEKTQVEGKIGTKKLIHKQATQGARTGNLNPSVKPSSPWRQEAARPARMHEHTHTHTEKLRGGVEETLKQRTLTASSTSMKRDALKRFVIVR